MIAGRTRALGIASAPVITYRLLVDLRHALLPGVRPGTAGLPLVLFGVFLAGGLGRALTRSVAYAGFLSHYPASGIPYVYVAVGLLLATLMPGYLWLAGRLAAPTLCLGTFVALGLGQALLWLARPVVPGAVDLVLPVWYEGLSLLLSLAMWTLAGQLLDVAQGKRLLGPIGSGFPIGFLVAGLATRPVVAWAGSSALLALGAVALAVGAGLVPVAARLRAAGSGRLGDTRVPRPGNDPSRPALGGLLRDRYVACLIGLFVCWTLAFYVADYMFYERSGARYPVEADLAAFMGTYSAVTGALTLVSGLLVTPWLMRRRGVRVAGYLMPAVLTLGAVPSVLIGLVAGASPAIFWPAFATKVGHYALDPVDRSVRAVLSEPLRPDVRLRVQSLGEGLGAALTTAAAGGLLLLGIQGLGAGVVEAGWLLLAVLAVWLLLARATVRAFPGRLASALDGRRLVGSALVLDATVLDRLHRTLRSERADEVLYGVDRLGEMGDPRLPELMEGLLGHPAPAVRSEIARRLAAAGHDRPEDEPGDRLVRTFRRRLEVEQDPAVLAVLAEVLAGRGTDADRDRVATLVPTVPDEGNPVPLAAATGLLRQGDPRRTAPLRQRLEGWRAAGAGPALAADLAEAIGAADPAAWRRVLSATGQPVLRERAGDAVVSAAGRGDPAAVTALVAALQAAGTGSELARLSRIAGRVARPEVSATLALRLAGWTARDRVVRDLVRSGWTVPGDPHDPLAVLHRVRTERERRLVGTVLGLDPRPGAGRPLTGRGPLGALVVEAAARERTQLVHRLLGLAALQDVSGAVRTATATLSSPTRMALDVRAGRPAVTERQQQYLAEVLEGVGERALVPLLDALLHPPGRGTPAAAGPPGPELDGLSRWTRTVLALDQQQEKGTGMPSIVERVLLLKQAALFGRMPDDVLASVAEQLRDLELAAGRPLFARGDPATDLFVIVTGSLRVHDQDRTIDLLGPGEVVGELALLDDTVRSATVTGVTDALLLALDRASLDELVADHPAFATGLIQVLTARLRARTRDVLAVADRPADPSR